jgi:acetoin utilization deacetylase AcuC-like enzyme
VALGVDAAAGDPDSPLEVTEPAFPAAGELLGGLGLPTVVQEAGFDLERIGPLVRETLLGIEGVRS